LLHVNDQVLSRLFLVRGSPFPGKERELTGVSGKRSASIGEGQMMEIQRLHRRGALTFEAQEFARIFFTARFFLSRLSAILQPIDKGKRPPLASSPPTKTTPPSLLRGATSTRDRRLVPLPPPFPLQRKICMHVACESNHFAKKWHSGLTDSLTRLAQVQITVAQRQGAGSVAGISGVYWSRLRAVSSMIGVGGISRIIIMDVRTKRILDA
jgi:hypothetical protein